MSWIMVKFGMDNSVEGYATFKNQYIDCWRDSSFIQKIKSLALDMLKWSTCEKSK